MLGVLLGVSSASPVISRPLLLLARAAYARLFGSVGNLAGQNSLRNPRRTTATASALMIGLTLACTMAIVGDSAKASVDRSIEENFVGDFVVSNVFGGPFSPSIAGRMAGSTGSTQVIRERYAFATRDGDRQADRRHRPGRARGPEPHHGRRRAVRAGRRHRAGLATTGPSTQDLAVGDR